MFKRTKRLLLMTLAGVMASSIYMAPVSAETNAAGISTIMAGAATSKGYMWNDGWQGIRVTVVDSKDGSRWADPVDFTTTGVNIQYSYIKKTKLEYKNGSRQVRSTSGYQKYSPPAGMPTRLMSGSPNNSSNSNVQALKDYFNKPELLKDLVSESHHNNALYKAGFKKGYDELISGKYKLLIEPVVYLKICNLMTALTTTEFGIYINDHTLANPDYYAIVQKGICRGSDGHGNVANNYSSSVDKSILMGVLIRNGYFCGSSDCGTKGHMNGEAKTHLVAREPIGYHLSSMYNITSYCLFLENSDLGISAPSGVNANSKPSTQSMISTFGVAVVNFKEGPTNGNKTDNATPKGAPNQRTKNVIKVYDKISGVKTTYDKTVVWSKWDDLNVQVVNEGNYKVKEYFTSKTIKNSTSTKWTDVASISQKNNKGSSAGLIKSISPDTALYVHLVYDTSKPDAGQQQTGTTIKADFINSKFIPAPISANTSGWNSVNNKSWTGSSADNSRDYFYMNSGGPAQTKVSYKFLGDREFTANGTNLRHASYMGALNPITNLPFLKSEFDRSSDTADTNQTKNVPLVSSTITGTIKKTYNEPYSYNYECKNPAKGKKCSYYDATVKKWLCDGSHIAHGTKPVTRTENISTNSPASSYTYDAEETVFESNKNAEYLVSHQTNRNGGTVITTFPVDDTNSISFNPTYKMNYYSGSSSEPSSIWMLATGERKFDFTPFIKVTSYGATSSVISPWSRDKQDVGFPLKVTKAGCAIKVNSEPLKYKIECTYYLQDPYFKSGSGTSFSTNSSYTDAMNTISSELTKLYSYSNVPFTGSIDSTIFNNLGIKNKLGKDLLKKSLVGTMKTSSVNQSSINCRVVRSNFNGSNDTNSSTTFNGSRISTTEDLSELRPLIVSGRDGWYDEDYEGVIKVVLTKTVDVRPNTNNWLEIYRGISDWRTGYNETNNPIEVDNVNFYNGKNFVLGYGGYMPNTNVSGINIPQMKLMNNYSEFQIRGNITDIAR